MLQWMGGSRRKVTTSRTSTHKRQKQYFEQRKRHQHRTTAFESYADGRCSDTENNRSLDIMSLVNVSSVAQEPIHNCINGNKSEGYGFTTNHQYGLAYQASLDDEALPVDQVQINEEGFPSGYNTEVVLSQKVPTYLQDHNANLPGKGNKLDPFKLSETLSEISVIDLLSDGKPNAKAEENLAHAREAHVSFIVEGLGKVETKTPVQSPRIHVRSFTKARRQPLTSKHIDDLVPVAQVDFDISPYRSSLEQTFRSKDMMNIVGDPNLKISNRKCFSPFNWDGCNSQGTFDNDKLIYNIRDSGRNIWNGLTFLDDNNDYLGEHEIFCKNWDDQHNVPYNDYYHDNDIWKDFKFDGQSLLERRFSTERTEFFYIRDSPLAYSNRRSILDLPPDKISNTRCSATTRVDGDVKDTVNLFSREDDRESLSLLSEESCSSTAVRGDATRKP